MIILFYFILCIVLNLSAQYINKKVCDIMFNERDRYNALPDIIHICTPSLACLYRIPDIIVTISLACTFIILAQLCYVSLVHREDIYPPLLFTIGEDINKLMTVGTTLMSIRVVCILVTYYPYYILVIYQNAVLLVQFFLL